MQSIKKLLILGAYKTEVEIVEAARNQGVYTIVTDNHKDWNDAPAKYAADEAWDISWSEIDILAKKCFEENIDGVMAGFSERRVEYASALSLLLNKPFYAVGANLDVILNKNAFKRACIDSGVEIAKHYEENDEISYPVIVKPVDNGGSRGISICYTRQELISGIEKAKQASDTKQVEIEEYIVADEVMVYYVVHDGEATLSAMCDRYMHSFDARITQLPVGYRFPSMHLPLFKKHHNHRFQTLISNLGIKNGLIAFQCFVKDNRVIPFDPTYRLDGTMAYHLTEEVNESNVLKMLINYSLTGSMGDSDTIRQKENPDFSVIGFELPILLGKGTINHIEGLDDIRSIDAIKYVFSKAKEGDVMENIADFSQIFCRIQMVAKNEAELENIITEVYSKLKIMDQSGADMVIYKNAKALALGEVIR